MTYLSGKLGLAADSVENASRRITLIAVLVLLIIFVIVWFGFSYEIVFVKTESGLSVRVVRSVTLEELSQARKAAEDCERENRSLNDEISRLKALSERDRVSNIKKTLDRIEANYGK